MDEKESIKLSLSTTLLIISIIIIAVMGYFIYTLSIKNKVSEEKINSLNSKVSNLENSNKNYQDKLNNISNTLNSANTTNSSNSTTNTTNSIGSSKISELNYNIDGTYWFTGELERIAYIFSNGKATLETNATEMGTYKIIGNTIKITFTKIIEPAEEKAKSINREEELKIQDNNTLINEQYNTKYIKGADYR